MLFGNNPWQFLESLPHGNHTALGDEKYGWAGQGMEEYLVKRERLIGSWRSMPKALGLASNT